MGGTFLRRHSKEIGRKMSSVDAFMNQIVAKNPAEPEFHQAVREVAESVLPVVESTPAYKLCWS